jgi:hypothetical protein
LTKAQLPALIIGVLISIIAFSLALRLFFLDVGGFYDSVYVYRFHLPIKLALIFTSISLALLVGRFFVLTCYKKDASSTSPTIKGTTVILAIDVFCNAVALAGAIVIVAIPLRGDWNVVLECSTKSNNYYYTDGNQGCAVYRILQASMWLLWVISAVVVSSSLSTLIAARKNETSFDDRLDGSSERTAATVIKFEKKKFSTAQFCLHVALWVFSTISLGLLSYAVSYNLDFYFFDVSPYDTPEVAYSLAVVCIVWLASSVYICLSLCTIAVEPIIVLGADTLFLLLTMASAGVLNALGGVNCSGTLCDKFVSGVAFIWLSMAVYIVLLVLNVLAVVQTTTSLIEKGSASAALIEKESAHHIEDPLCV